MEHILNPRKKEFEHCLQDCLNAAFGYAQNLTRNRDDAEDLVQEAAVQAFSAFKQFEPGTNFRAWYFRILVNCFRNRWRKKQREPITVDIEDPPMLYLYRQNMRMEEGSTHPDPALVVLDRMSTEQVARAISSLPEEFCETAALYFLEEFNYQEIADILDCPVGTVRSRLHRGRKLLQKALWDLAEESGIVANEASEKKQEIKTREAQI